ncbi:MAG: hypothetical protein EBX41_04800 [Chitinophagia bacterium]|nr:hypothetical protein [Chitinophagia bacterium]
MEHNSNIFFKYAVYVCAVFLLLWGGVMVAFPIKPFWIDEWRLIANLKFKAFNELWQPLSYTQQFPRLYLFLLKQFCHAFNYSYFSLRFPAYLLTVFNMALAFYLMKKLYTLRHFSHYLFFIIFTGSSTFIDYMVQTKHYEMELLLSLVALWQLYSVNQLLVNKTPNAVIGYFLLCGSFFICPFFSYTYPIAAAPIYGLVALQYMFSFKKHSLKDTLLLFMPLIAGIAGIALAYKTDIAQLMADKQMHGYWQYKMISEGSNPVKILGKLWGFFAIAGSGFVFEILFATASIAGCAFAMQHAIKALKKGALAQTSVLLLYPLALTGLVILLFFMGKLPMGEPKFNAFAIPALSLAIIRFIEHNTIVVKGKSIALTVAGLLFIGSAGNMVSSCINTFTAPEYARRIKIYNATQTAINTAQQKGYAIYTTPLVAWPDEIMIITPHLTNIPPAVVLKTFPAYDAGMAVPVYNIDTNIVKKPLAYPCSQCVVISGEECVVHP